MTTLSRIGWGALLAGCVSFTSVALWSERSTACPFCAAVSLTFSEEINNSQVAVIAKLVQVPPKPGDAAANAPADLAKAKFEIVKILKGEEALGKNRTIETVYFGESPLGTKFLIMGIDPPTINWGTPIAIIERGEAYVAKAIELPKEGADRLAYFQDYLEDSDEMLARDAYDEFAKAPYSGVVDLKGRLKHDKIMEWIKSPQIPVSRRRLYLTMLGVCGTEKDLPLMEEMIQSKDRTTKGALDALVAAYLTLKGPSGMALVEDLYLKNKDAEYTDTYATIMALRFHGTEEKIIPRERLLEGIRTMLDRPQLADLVIPDLARWEDWSVVDRLVDLFKNADDESSWVRVPVINYLRACPLPVAKERIEELTKLDPESVKRANSFFPLAGAAAPPVAAGGDQPAKDDESAAAAKDNPAPAKDDTAAAEDDGPVPAPVADTDADKPKAKSAPAPAKPQPAKSQSVEPVPAAASETDSGLAAPLAKDAALPAPPIGNLSIFGGLAGAAVLLGCAFWAILKGGQHAAG